jgi:hypothetical protein
MTIRCDTIRALERFLNTTIACYIVGGEYTRSYLHQSLRPLPRRKRQTAKARIPSEFGTNEISHAEAKDSPRHGNYLEPANGDTSIKASPSLSLAFRPNP